MDFIVSVFVTAVMYTGPFVVFRYGICQAAIGKKPALISIVLFSFIAWSLLYAIYPSVGLDPPPSYLPLGFWGCTSYAILITGK